MQRSWNKRSFADYKILQRANITYHKSSVTLDKEKTRLRRQFRAQEIQLKKAKKRFEQRKGARTYTEQKMNGQGTQNKVRSKKNNAKYALRHQVAGLLPPIYEQNKGNDIAQLTTKVPSLNISDVRLKSPEQNERGLICKTQAALKFLGVKNCNAKNKSTPQFPPRQDLYSRGRARSLNTICSDSFQQADSNLSKHDSVKIRSMSTLTPTPCLRMAFEKEQERSPSSNLQSTEERFGMWPPRKVASFSSISLRARVKFLTTLSSVFRPSNDNKWKYLESTPTKRTEETEKIDFKDLEKCRYLRTPKIIDRS